MTHKIALSLAFALAALPALAQDAETPAEAPTADTVIATVGDTEITLGHMIMARARLPQQVSNYPDEVLFEGVLDQLIQQTLLAQEAPEPDRVTTLSLENEERTLLSNQVIVDISTAALSDEAVQAAYDEEFGGFEGSAEYNASHILVETEEEALALIEQLDGGADFATLAMENSTGPSGPNGGQLGWFGEGQMVAPFFDGVVALEVGGVSPPVETQFGWHVIKLNDTRLSEAPPLEAVRQDIEMQVRRDAVDARIAELRESITVEQADLSTFDASLISNFELIQN